MKFNENINIPTKGMDTDNHPSRLSESSYIYALNTALEDFSGNGFPMLQNEPSNLLCTKFKEGYKVVGFKTSIVENKVYFFLTHPEEKRSEIGFVQGSPQIINTVDVETQCGCDIIKLLDTPLEENLELVLKETCSYTTLIGDNCKDSNGNYLQEKPCLNFSIDHPIMEGNIVIKTEKTGNKIYWTDGLNPQRSLDLFKLEQGYYSKTGVTVCDIEYNVSDTCIDCEKLKIFKTFEKPCLEPERLIVGGSLPMGIYQFLIAYCDMEGNELSPYYSMTNPISIFDHNKVSMTQAELSNRTNLGIKLNVEGLDNKYPYYKIVVIKRNDSQFTESYLVEGVHPISETTVLYDREYVDNERITLDRIMSLNPIYDSANIFTSSGGFLFQGDLVTHGEINLQPVVNLMGGFLKWKSSKAKEDLYRDGVNISLYTGYMRDEVYPFGIRFFTNKGFVTPIFPFISRPPRQEEILPYNKTGLNYKSIKRFNPECTDSIRDKVWQYENTAVINTDSPCRKNLCTEESDNCEKVTQDIEKSCITNVYKLVPKNNDYIKWSFSPNGSYSGLLNELNSNLNIIKQNNPILYNLILGGFPDIHCTPNFNLQEGDTCSNPIMVGNPIVFVSEVNEIGTPFFVPKDLNDYQLLQDIIENSPVTDEEENITTPCTKFVLNNNNPIKDSSLANTLAQKIGIDDSTRFNNFECTIYSRNTYDDSSSTKPCIKNYSLSQGNYNGKDVFNKQEVYPGWEIWTPCNDFFISDKCLNPLFEKKDCDIDFWVNLNENVIDSSTFYCNPKSFNNCDKPYYIARNNYNLDKAFSKYSSNLDFTEPLNLGLYSKPEYDLKIAANATWIKIKKRDDGKGILLDFSKNTEIYEDVLTAKEIRLSFFKSCDDLIAYKTVFVNSGQGLLHNLNCVINFSSLQDFPVNGDKNVHYKDSSNGNVYVWNGSSYILSNDVIDLEDNDYVYIAIDTRLKAIYSFDEPKGSDGNSTGWRYRAVGFINKYIDGCFKVTYRDEEYSSITVKFDKLLVDKKEKYKTTCEYFQPTSNSCGITLDRVGDFGYYESIKEYPDNKELYDSSYLKIKKSLIPYTIKDSFEDYYVDKSINLSGVYKLDYNSTNFRCKPIRHYRFPSNELIPYISNRQTDSNEEVDIYPLGVFIDNEVIESFLNIAVENNLIDLNFKNSITGYEILRGDRTLDKSVVAKGILFDVYEYTEGNKKALYSNYPYNDLGDDILNMSDVNRYSAIQHPYNGNGNNRFTFHSPDLHFNPPTILPSEMIFDGYIFGKSKGVFSEVINHPKWVILGDRAYSVARTLATAECVFEAIIAAAEASSRAQVWFVGGFTNGGSFGIPSFVAAATIGAASAVSSVMFKYARYRNQWLETIKNLGTPKNFASYYTSIGYYNYFNSHTNDSSKNNYLRGIAFSKYMRQGNHNVVEKFGNQGGTHQDYMFNNTDREFTYYLSIGKNFNINYEDFYKIYDNNRIDGSTSSKTFTSKSTSCGAEKYSGVSSEIVRNIASPYVTLRTYLPSQYGSLNSIRWINTNYCGKLYEQVLNQENKTAIKSIYDNSCDIIFGGDTFISRFSLKRKFPFFYINAMNESDMLPFNYAAYRNVGFPRFYVDYGVDDSMSLGSISMPSMINDYNFDCLFGKNSFYVKPPSKFYLFYYGIPNFLVESEINCNFRYAGRELHEEFYPQTGNYVDWTQEKNVSIKTPEVFNYNNIYSSRAILSGTQLNRTLPIDFNKEYWNRANNLENVVIYSQPDASEIQIFDPWSVYKMNNRHQFATANGKLIDIRGIESEQILVRFENTFEVHNAINQYKDGINANTVNSGTGTLFSARPISFNNTDLGYGGTQHKALLSTEFGHFWADAMRGQVFMVDPNGRNLKEITQGKRNWFKEHLPFKIIKSVENMTHLDTDNNFKGLGLIFGYDSRFKRIFLTKRDYIAKNKCIEFKDGNFYLNLTKCNDVPPKITCPDGYEYNEDTNQCEKIIYTSLCSQGDSYNSSTNQCERVLTEAPIVTTETTETKTCAPGYTLSADGSVCEKVVTTNLCPTGYTYNGTKCVKTVDCPVEIVFNRLLSQTEIPNSIENDKTRLINILTSLKPKLDAGILKVAIVNHYDYLAQEETPLTSNYNTLISFINTVGTPQTYNIDYGYYMCRASGILKYGNPNAKKIIYLICNATVKTECVAASGTCAYNCEGNSVIIKSRNRPSGILNMRDYFQNANPGGKVKMLIVNGTNNPDYNDLLDGYVQGNSKGNLNFPLPEIGSGLNGLDAYVDEAGMLASINAEFIGTCTEEITPVCNCQVVDDKCRCLLTAAPIVTTETTITKSCSEGYEYDEETDSCLKLTVYEPCKSCLQVESSCQCKLEVRPTVEDVLEEVQLTDSRYFDDVSFTMAYSPYTESWISYYSFKPDYYISFNNYFQTGLNFSRDKKEEGLWSHLLTNKSYQVFYGKKYPWTIELPFKNNMVNKVLESVSFWLDSRRYHNEYDFAEKRNEGFNKSWIYNNSNNSGRLDLIVENKNDLYQKTLYPRFTGISNEILITENDKRWSFNYFYNEVRNELNNNPIWYWDKNVIDKVINMDALKYNNPWKDRLRGDFFNVILSQDKETRFKYIFKWISTKENMYKN